MHTYINKFDLYYNKDKIIIIKINNLKGKE